MISLDQNTPLHLRYPGFSSYKTTTPIHYRHRYCRIMLALDSLDGSISEICGSQLEFGREIGCDCLYRRRTGKAWETIFIGRPPGSNPRLRFDRALTREQVLSLPGAETARMIWQKRNTQVTLSSRMLTLELTADDREITLGKLLRCILDAGGTPDELLALLADGTLLIEPRKALSFWTPIRRRSAEH